MPKKSIIERIAEKREKKRHKRKKQRKSQSKRSLEELEITELEHLKAKLEAKKESSDDSLLEAIKTELRSKKTAQKILKRDIKDIDQLVDSGTQEDWVVFFGENLKSNTKMKFPPIDTAKCKFNDYGYRQLIELIIDSGRFLRLIIELKDISGFQVVTLNHLIRGDVPTLRGIEALCNLIINEEIQYNPVCETDFKYLNVLLDSFTISKKQGINRIWDFDIQDKNIEVSAKFDKVAREWIYTFVKSQP